MLRLLQIDMADYACRLAARREVLQLSCGVFELFGMRVCTEHYRLSWIAMSDVPERMKKEAVHQFFDIPMD